MNYREQAHKIYQQVHPTERYIKMMGENSLRPIQRATIEQIKAHLVLIAEIAQEYNVRLSPEKIEFGAGRDQIVEIADRKAAKSRRRRGYQTLKRKYGTDSAKRIISGTTLKHDDPATDAQKRKLWAMGIRNFDWNNIKMGEAHDLIEQNE